jgi:hypothetical protein
LFEVRRRSFLSCSITIGLDCATSRSFKAASWNEFLDASAFRRSEAALSLAQ